MDIFLSGVNNKKPAEKNFTGSGSGSGAALPARLRALRSLPRHWICLRFSALGDVILTSGVMRYLHARYGWTFTVLTRESFAALFTPDEAVTGCIAAREEDLHGAPMLAWFRKLARQYKDCGLLDLHGNLRSRLLGLLWRGAVLRYPKESAARRVLLKSKRRRAAVSEALRAHNVTQRYALAAEDDAPERSALRPYINLTEAETAQAAARLAGAFVQGFPAQVNRAGPVALHPFATHAHKAWPREYWRRLAALLDAAHIPWVIVGQGEKIFSADRRDLTNETTLRELASILSLCRLLVTGDSGPMHLASAAGTKVLALFGPTTEEWGFFPSGPYDHVLELPMECRPCSLHGDANCPFDGKCLAGIAPDKVMEKIVLSGTLHDKK